VTHDELIAKVIGISKENEKYVTNLESILTPNAKALRAVVKLHYQQNDGGYCNVCPDFDYPCETIQAIEKELA
jgi:hypothetical protein